MVVVVNDQVIRLAANFVQKVLVLFKIVMDEKVTLSNLIAVGTLLVDAYEKAILLIKN